MNLKGDGITTVDEALEFADITKKHFGQGAMIPLLSDQSVLILAAEVRRHRAAAAVKALLPDSPFFDGDLYLDRDEVLAILEPKS